MSKCEQTLPFIAVGVEYLRGEVVVGALCNAVQCICILWFVSVHTKWSCADVNRINGTRTIGVQYHISLVDNNETV